MVKLLLDVKADINAVSEVLTNPTCMQGEPSD